MLITGVKRVEKRLDPRSINVRPRKKEGRKKVSAYKRRSESLLPYFLASFPSPPPFPSPSLRTICKPSTRDFYVMAEFKTFQLDTIRLNLYVEANLTNLVL